MKLHPRRKQVVEARLEITNFVLEVLDKYDLTFVETVSVFASVLDLLTQHAVRDERHPDDPDKGGDEDGVSSGD